ncbi:hypothetical protein [Actinocrispum sp. NPDC049592]|uniref:hypothetical protein n=1 Tax=Actinocrispum sp. NPDC049592 TaxID=3154835 RepID=UPI003441DEAC
MGRLKLFATSVLLAVGALLPVSGSAQAAVPDAYAFATWDGVATADMFPAGAIAPGAPGVYQVTFGGVGGPGGVVHVTAISSAGHSCQALAWGASLPNEIVLVRCYNAAGVLANTGFTVTYSRSTPLIVGPGQHAYADVPGPGVPANRFNQLGAVTAVDTNGPPPGEMTVTFAGVASPTFAGNIQVTAVNQVAVRCKVSGWIPTPNLQVRVWCFNAAGTPVDSRFTISYSAQRNVFGGWAAGGKFAYLSIWPGGVAPITFTVGQTNFNNVTGPNTNSAAGPFPDYQLKLPQVFFPVDDLQVTALGVDNRYCGIASLWGNAGPDVIGRVLCFTPGGAPAPSGSSVTYGQRT